jgi:hypothetical protein
MICWIIRGVNFVLLVCFAQSVICVLEALFDHVTQAALPLPPSYLYHFTKKPWQWIARWTCLFGISWLLLLVVYFYFGACISGVQPGPFGHFEPRMDFGHSMVFGIGLWLFIRVSVRIIWAIGSVIATAWWPDIPQDVPLVRDASNNAMG